MDKLLKLWQSTGLYHIEPGQALMIVVCLALIYLAIRKGFEPLLLIAAAQVERPVRLANTVEASPLTRRTPLGPEPWRAARQGTGAAQGSAEQMKKNPRLTSSRHSPIHPNEADNACE